jgi:hypothetical protein
MKQTAARAIPFDIGDESRKSISFYLSEEAFGDLQASVFEWTEGQQDTFSSICFIRI